MSNPVVSLLNPFKNTPEGCRAFFWYKHLFNMAVSLFKWKGLPPSVNIDYLNAIRMIDGSIIFINDKEGNLRALRGTHYGLDCYNFPTTVLIENHVLGSLTGQIGTNAVWCRNSKLAESGLCVIQDFAEQLAKIDIDINVNLQNIKSTKIFTANTDEEAQNIRKMYDDISRGNPIVIKQDIFSQFADKPFVHSCDVEYYVSKLLTDRRVIINDFLTTFGIDNNNVEKRERVIADEVNSNNHEILVNRAYWLEPLVETCEDIKKIFGYSVSVDIVSPDEREGNYAQL